MEKDWIKLRTYSDALRAEMDRQMLEENGVMAVRISKQDSSFNFGRIDVFVNKADEQTARQLLGEAQNGEENEG